MTPPKDKPDPLKELEMGEDELYDVLRDLIESGHVKMDYNEQDDDAFIVPTGKE